MMFGGDRRTGSLLLCVGLVKSTQRVLCEGFGLSGDCLEAELSGSRCALFSGQGPLWLDGVPCIPSRAASAFRARAACLWPAA